MKVFNRFFYKLIFLFILLIAFLILETRNNEYASILKNEMNSNINFVNIIEVFKGDLFNEYFNGDKEVSSNVYIVSSNDGNRLILETDEVICLEPGQVIKIVKDNNKEYEVYIQTSTCVYLYSGIKEIDVDMYQLIKKNDFIGKSTKFDNNFYCYIDLLNDEYSYE